MRVEPFASLRLKRNTWKMWELIHQSEIVRIQKRVEKSPRLHFQILISNREFYEIENIRFAKFSSNRLTLLLLIDYETCGIFFV